MQWRQGDVLIERIDDTTPLTQPVSGNLLVRGEGRYHGHFATGDIEVYCDEHHMYLNVITSGKIEHLHTETLEFTGEHHPITLPKGKYRIIRQREYNPYEKSIMLVQD